MTTVADGGSHASRFSRFALRASTPQQTVRAHHTHTLLFPSSTVLGRVFFGLKLDESFRAVRTKPCRFIRDVNTRRSCNKRKRVRSHMYVCVCVYERLAFTCRARAQRRCHLRAVAAVVRCVCVCLYVRARIRFHDRNAAAAATTVVPHRRPTCSTGAAAAARCAPVRRDRDGGPDGGVASPGFGTIVQLPDPALGP